MKAIITVDVPEHQIGQEVSVYFKDSMCVKGVCKKWIPNNATNGDVLSLLFQDDSFHISADKHGYLHIRGVKKEWWNAPYERRADETDN